MNESDQNGRAAFDARWAAHAQQQTEGDQFTQDEWEVINKWSPKVIGQKSEYLGKVIHLYKDLLLHVEAHNAQEAKKLVKDRKAANGQRWKEWQEQCRQRKTWIEQKAAQWHKAVEERRQALKQWDLYVEAARLQYEQARETSPPPQPSETGGA